MTNTGRFNINKMMNKTYSKNSVKVKNALQNNSVKADIDVDSRWRLEANKESSRYCSNKMNRKKKIQKQIVV